MAYQFEHIKILVVEDSTPMLEILKALLKTFGVGEILTAKEGGEGYDLFKKHNPDIVIADWMMMPIDGMKLCEWIRTRKDSPNLYVPIILMTGYSERKRVYNARDKGITEFLVKPFKAQDLYKRISQVIERPRQFVKSEDFFGPDRRRTAEDYKGPERRGLRDDSMPYIYNPDDEIDFA